MFKVNNKKTQNDIIDVVLRFFVNTQHISQLFLLFLLLALNK